MEWSHLSITSLTSDRVIINWLITMGTRMCPAACLPGPQEYIWLCRLETMLETAAPLIPSSIRRLSP